MFKNETLIETVASKLASKLTDDHDDHVSTKGVAYAAAVAELEDDGRDHQPFLDRFWEVLTETPGWNQPPGGNELPEDAAYYLPNAIDEARRELGLNLS